MSDSADQLRTRLRALGLADPAIDAAWPTWWSEDAEASTSARAELRFGVARRLGLDPGSLLAETGEPRFVWREEARFKNLATEDETERAGIASFGRALTMALADAVPPAEGGDITGIDASTLRELMLRSGQPFLSLGDLIAACWGTGVAVVHLRVFPWRQKRMAAMAVRTGDHPFVLLGKDSEYPPWAAFYVAHELAHIVLGHVAQDEAIIDLDRDDEADTYVDQDDEERQADAWALELLTGQPEPEVLSADGRSSAASLAQAALARAPELRIEPGTLALCFGFSTGNWAAAVGSLRHIYASPAPVWRAINTYALSQLQLNATAADADDFVTAVLGFDELG